MDDDLGHGALAGEGAEEGRDVVVPAGGSIANRSSESRAKPGPSPWARKKVDDLCVERCRSS